MLAQHSSFPAQAIMFRRRGQSDDRRRRVLSEESGAGGTSGSAHKPSTKGGSRSPYDDATLQSQPRITDLVPLRSWQLVLLTLTGGAAVAGLLMLHQRLGTAPAIAELSDVTVRGSVANWFSSLLLATAAIVATVCFSVRRHKQSDYHGRYRVWLGVAGVALLMSGSVATGWHHVAGRSLSTALAWKLPMGTLLYWLVPTVLVLSYFAVRLMFEMRGCRSGIAALLSAAAAYLSAVIVAIALAQRLDAVTGTLLVHGGLMTGHLMLLVACSAYARYVILHAGGKITVDRPTRRDNSTETSRRAKSADRGASSVRADPAQTSAAANKGRSDLEPDMPATRRRRPKAESEDDEDQYEVRPRRAARRQQRPKSRPVIADYDEYDEQDLPQRQRKLSKAERKRQRRLKARQRDAA